jgi:hypothetical protein
LQKLRRLFAAEEAVPILIDFIGDEIEAVPILFNFPVRKLGPFDLPPKARRFSAVKINVNVNALTWHTASGLLFRVEVA